MSTAKKGKKRINVAYESDQLSSSIDVGKSWKLHYVHRSAQQAIQSFDFSGKKWEIRAETLARGFEQHQTDEKGTRSSCWYYGMPEMCWWSVE